MMKSRFGNLLRTVIKNKTINSKIRICVDCGSTLIFLNEKSLMCRDCGNIRDFCN